MRVAGFSLGQVVKIGVAAALFFLAFKLIANKTQIPALQRVAAAL